MSGQSPRARFNPGWELGVGMGSFYSMPSRKSTKPSAWFENFELSQHSMSVVFAATIFVGHRSPLQCRLATQLIERSKFGDRFRALATVLIGVIVFGAKFLTKHEMFRLHVADFKRLLGLRPFPTSGLPAGLFRRRWIDWCDHCQIFTPLIHERIFVRSLSQEKSTFNGLIFSRIAEWKPPLICSLPIRRSIHSWRCRKSLCRKQDSGRRCLELRNVRRPLPNQDISFANLLFLSSRLCLI